MASTQQILATTNKVFNLTQVFLEGLTSCLDLMTTMKTSRSWTAL